MRMDPPVDEKPLDNSLDISKQEPEVPNAQPTPHEDPAVEQETPSKHMHVIEEKPLNKVLDPTKPEPEEQTAEQESEIPNSRPTSPELPTGAKEAPSTHPADIYHEGNIDEPISVDSNDDDSAIGDLSRLSSTTSARASLFDFVQEDGRTFHRYRQGKYMLPNDEMEQDRLDMQHHLWLMTLDDNLSLAPVKQDPHHVLDLGTGTGIWAIDYALEHPSAAVRGSDLSPIQPNFVPVNCVFEVEDFEDEWTYEQKFDLIHGRLLLSCFSNPKRAFEQAFQHLAPGGFFEMQDADFPGICADDTLTGSALQKWYTNILAGAAALGRDVGIVKHYKRWMEEVGFVNVQERLYRWPINTWPRDPHLKKLGFWYQQDLTELAASLRPPLTRGLGWSTEEVEVFLVDVRKDIKSRGIHAYHIIRVVYGMKPE